MIYPLVIHPDVFHSLYEKDEIPKNIKNFFYKIIYNDYQNEKFFFIDDTNETLKKVYKDIINNILPGKPLRILIDELIKQIKIEEINKNIDISNLDNLINDLKVKYYFKKLEDFNNIENTEKTYRLNEIELEKLNKLLIDFTKYGKQITFFDPYIIQQMTNLLDQEYKKTGIKNIDEKIENIKKNIEEKFNFEIKKIDNSYKISLKKFLNLIYENNIYKDKIEILIITAIKKKDLDKLIAKLDVIKKLYISENDENIKKKYLIFYNSICESISNNNMNIIFSKIINECLKVKSSKNQNLFVKIKNDYEKNKKTQFRFYNKGIKVKGSSINSVVDVGSSLNFFEDNSTLNNSKKVKNIMKKLSSFKLELKDTSKEKKSLTTPGSFEDYKLSKDQEKQLENKIIN